MSSAARPSEGRGMIDWRAAGPSGRAAPFHPAALRQQARRLLARRDYSRVELRQKLLAPPARARMAAALSDHDERPPADPAVVDQVLDALEAERLLSDQRFAETVVRGRSARLGVLRLSQSLKAKGIDPALAEAVLSPVRSTERDRALALWQRRFGAAPADADPRARARQHRFLLARGFDSATVGWVLKQARAADVDADVDVDVEPAEADDPAG